MDTKTVPCPSLPSWASSSWASSSWASSSLTESFSLCTMCPHCELTETPNLTKTHSILVRRIEVSTGHTDIEYSVQCPACRAEEEAEFRRTLVELENEIEAQRQHLRVLELERDELFQRQNPVLYDCPYCLYRKLRTGVTPCPSCHAEITQEQWRPIFEIERALAREWPKKELKHEYKAQYPPKVTDANRT